MLKHQLVYGLRDELLHLLSLHSGAHFEGLAAAARAVLQDKSQRNLRTALVRIDYAYNLVRHITEASMRDHVNKVKDSLSVDYKFAAKQHKQDNQYTVGDDHTVTDSNSGNMCITTPVQGSAHHGILHSDLHGVVDGHSGHDKFGEASNTIGNTIDMLSGKMKWLEEKIGAHGDRLDELAEVAQAPCQSSDLSDVETSSKAMSEAGGGDRGFLGGRGHNEHASRTEDANPYQGLSQYYVELSENGKNKKLMDILGVMEAKLITFVRFDRRAEALSKVLGKCNFLSIAFYKGLQEEDRLELIDRFKQANQNNRLSLVTDNLERGIDIGTNFVINYDMPADSESYLNQVRGALWNATGLVISFVASADDDKALKEIQANLGVNIGDLSMYVDGLLHSQLFCVPQAL